MRAALLLSALIIICGVAALCGVPSVYLRGLPIFGIAGFATALLSAAIPPIAVFGWRKLFPKQHL